MGQVVWYMPDKQNISVSCPHRTCSLWARDMWYGMKRAMIGEKGEVGAHRRTPTQTRSGNTSWRLNISAGNWGLGRNYPSKTRDQEGRGEFSLSHNPVKYVWLALLSQEDNQASQGLKQLLKLPNPVSGGCGLGPQDTQSLRLGWFLVPHQASGCTSPLYLF